MNPKRSMIIFGGVLAFVALFMFSTSSAFAPAKSSNAGRNESTPILFQAAGPSVSSIQSSVDAYRTQLGTLNPNVVGSFASGRREINWDGVPDMFRPRTTFRLTSLTLIRHAAPSSRPMDLVFR